MKNNFFSLCVFALIFLSIRKHNQEISFSFSWQKIAQTLIFLCRYNSTVFFFYYYFCRRVSRLSFQSQRIDRFTLKFTAPCRESRTRVHSHLTEINKLFLLYINCRFRIFYENVFIR